MPTADSTWPSAHRWSIIIAAIGLLLAVPGALLAAVTILNNEDSSDGAGGFDPEELFVNRPDVTAGDLVGTYQFLDVDNELFESTFPIDVPEEFLETMREQVKEQLRQRSRIRIEADEFIHATRCEGGTLFVRDPATIDPAAMTITLAEARTESTVQADGTPCGAGFDGVTTFAYSLNGLDLTLTIPGSGSFHLRKASD